MKGQQLWEAQLGSAGIPLPLGLLAPSCCKSLYFRFSSVLPPITSTNHLETRSLNWNIQVSMGKIHHGKQTDQYFQVPVRTKELGKISMSSSFILPFIPVGLTTLNLKSFANQQDHWSKHEHYLVSLLCYPRFGKVARIKNKVHPHHNLCSYYSKIFWAGRNISQFKMRLQRNGPW